MVKTIVVPLDGSALSETAVAPARWLAANLDADIHLITATIAPDIAPDDEYLQAKRTDLGIDGVSVHVLPFAFPAAGIIEHVAGTPDAMVCMATHGHSGVGAMVLGGVAELVVRDATAPVVLVGPQCLPLGLEPGPIVMCWDESTASRSAVPLAASLADALGVEASLVTVRTPKGEGDELGASPQLQARVERIVHRFAAADVALAYKVLDGRDPAVAIVDYAGSVGASLIIAATHGHGGMLQGTMGRVVSKIVRHSTCPVVVRRPQPDDS